MHLGCLDQLLHKENSTFDNPHQEVIIAAIIGDQCLELADTGLQIYSREFLRSLPHVLYGKIVSLEQLEAVNTELHDTAYLEVSV